MNYPKRGQRTSTNRSKSNDAKMGEMMHRKVASQSKGPAKKDAKRK